MFLIIKTIRTYIFWFLTTAIFLPICLLLSLLPEDIRRNRVYYFFTFIWDRLLVFFSFVLVKVEGKENLPKYPQKPAVFVMNHISSLDIPIIEDLIGTYPHVWISKAEYAKIPLWGTLLKRMHVLVDRHSPQKSMRALVKACNLVKNKNIHLLVFPEGTRSADGKLQNFLRGFATLAKKVQRSVIPVAIIGTNKVMPKKSFWLNPRASDVKLIIGKSFSLKDDESEKDFVERVQNWFRQTLDKDACE